MHPECTTWEMVNIFEMIYNSISGYHLHSFYCEKDVQSLAKSDSISQQQADTTVINEEEVTCHLLHFSHFVLNVIYVIDSAGSRCPNALSPRVVEFSAVQFPEEQNTGLIINNRHHHAAPTKFNRQLGFERGGFLTDDFIIWHLEARCSQWIFI